MKMVFQSKGSKQKPIKRTLSDSLVFVLWVSGGSPWKLSYLLVGRRERNSWQKDDIHVYKQKPNQEKAWVANYFKGQKYLCVTKEKLRDYFTV